MQFSKTLCISIFLCTSLSCTETRFPSQPAHLSYTWDWDSRPGYHLHAVINITWERPQGSCSQWTLALIYSLSLVHFWCNSCHFDTLICRLWVSWVLLADIVFTTKHWLWRFRIVSIYYWWSSECHGVYSLLSIYILQDTPGLRYTLSFIMM